MWNLGKKDVVLIAGTRNAGFTGYKYIPKIREKLRNLTQQLGGISSK